MKTVYVQFRFEDEVSIERAKKAVEQIIEGIHNDIAQQGEYLEAIPNGIITTSAHETVTKSN